MTNSNKAIPTAIKLHKRSKTLELVYSDGQSFHLSSEFLRVHSPSAEVKGHGPNQATLQTGKINVAINTLQAVGNYALQIVFDDGHDSGIYSWNYLYQLCTQQDAMWEDYLKALQQQGANRDPDVQTLRIGL